MKYILIFVCLSVFLLAESVEISIVSDNFSADENKHISTFTSNVKIVKQSDKISANKVVVKFDNNNTPISYEAFGSVHFTISLKNSTVDGSCEKLVYLPVGKIYTLSSKVDIVEYPSGRKMKANNVKIDTINAKTVVSGSAKKPVKFIFNIQEK